MIRKHLSLTHEADRTLMDLKVRTGASSESEVIRKALALYDTMADKIRDGKMVIVRDEGSVNFGEERLTVAIVVYR